MAAADISIRVNRMAEGEVRTVKVLEVGQLNTLAHAKHVGRGAEAIDHHPDVASIESGDLAAGITAALNGMLDVGPGGDDGAENHQAEGEEGHVGDRATEPEDLTIGDQNDGQVLEDGVDGDGEELEGLGAGVDHADQQKRNGEPYPRRNKNVSQDSQHSLRLRNWWEENPIHFLASSELKSR